MKLVTQNKIIEKAKAKKNGCYRYGGVAYRVVGGRVTHYADRGDILETAYGFNCVVGSYDYSMAPDEVGQKLLKKIPLK